MNLKFRTIEIDVDTAAALEQLAAARGTTVAEFLAELVQDEQSLLTPLSELRENGRGPWAPEIMAQDARRLAEYERSGEGVPWHEIRAWMRSWGTPGELPPPKPRKL